MKLKALVGLLVILVVFGGLVFSFRRDKLSALSPYIHAEVDSYVHEPVPPYRPVRQRVISVKGLPAETITEIAKKQYPASDGWHWYAKFPTADRRDNDTEEINIAPQKDSLTIVQITTFMSWSDVAWFRLTHIGSNPFDHPPIIKISQTGDLSTDPSRSHSP